MELTKWLTNELNILLECEVGIDYAQNILKINSEIEIKEFIGSLLDLNVAKNRSFLNELLKKLNLNHNSDIFAYLKPDIQESNKDCKNRKNNLAIKLNENLLDKNKELPVKTSKIVNVQNTSKTSIRRHHCNCQATKHKLVHNCLKCGRIVCEAEGSGPCYFCSALVCTKLELEKITRESKKAENLRLELLNRTYFENTEDLDQAIQHKNKLIDFDRSSAKRTEVIDDEMDYFNTNSKWLSQNQKNMLEVLEKKYHDKKSGSKINTSYTLDFAGRKIMKNQPDNIISYGEIENILKESANEASIKKNHDFKLTELSFVDDLKDDSKFKTVEDFSQISIIRIQDIQLQLLKDEGMCLSMHQPWASLLIKGIKKHEGREWYSPYRGILWIHAGSKKPNDSETKEIENQYTCLYSSKKLNFPESYPTGCILGYVDLVDCLNSESYKSKYPGGESCSKFVYICENPRELVVKIPITGQSKIFKLDKEIHKVAKKTAISLKNQ